MTSTDAVVLLIEDELPMRRLLQLSLKHKGYRLLETGSGREGVSLAEGKNPDVILLDLGLPDIDGIDVAQSIRSRSSVPIIVVSARDSEEQKILALDAGADDYVTKPFSMGELLARVHAAIRRSGSSLSEANLTGIFHIGDLEVDFDARQLRRGKREIHVTPTEYKLLCTLISSAGKVVTHRQLLRRVWGPAAEEHVQYLRVYMKQLREKIEPLPRTPQFLITEPAVGYRLRLPD